MQIQSVQMFRMLEIIAAHHKAKTASRIFKQLQNVMGDSLESLERLKRQRYHEYLSMGHYEDCGESYKEQYFETKAQYEYAAKQEPVIQKLLSDVITLKNLERGLKRQYAAEFGEEALQEVQTVIDDQGRQDHQLELQRLKQVKAKCKPLEDALQYVHGRYCGYHLDYILKREAFDVLQIKNRPWTRRDSLKIQDPGIRAEFKAYVRANAPELKLALQQLVQVLRQSSPKHSETTQPAPETTAANVIERLMQD